jgi:SAM-dependent methyltransferase
MTDEIEKFIDAFTESLRAGTFVKLTLGNYKGSEGQLQKIFVRPVTTKKGDLIAFQKRFSTRETVTNEPSEQSGDFVRGYLEAGFRNAHLFTTANDFRLDIGKRSSRLKSAKPTFDAAAARPHDREKRRFVDHSAYYLKALGIATDKGEIIPSQQDKWRQVNKFVETLGHLIDESTLKDARNLRVLDMGSGKGYLTFAAYDHLVNSRGIEVDMTGVDTKNEIVALCNDIAAASGFSGLKFVNGTIGDFETEGVDVLIALHACDTATDDALFEGITSEAKLMIVAPCCHKEIRRQIKAPHGLHNFLKHGTLLEQTAETVTDGLRALLLERSGYKTRVFEFINPENTPKNNMIAAVRAGGPRHPERFDAEIAAVKALYGIGRQRLEELLA